MKLHLSAVVVLLIAGLLLPAAPAYAQVDVPDMPERSVKDNVLYSAALPEISIKVSDEFEYLGKFDFILKNIAYGERYVFADINENKVERLFIFQFEGFLPDNNHTYNYNFSNAEVMQGHRFRQNTWAYSNEQSAQSAPGGEGALTAAFLKEKGLSLEDELMMSRFLTVPDVERRNELILFYLENASPTGHAISSFYDANDRPTPHWRQISEGLTARSRDSFEILEGAVVQH